MLQPHQLQNVLRSCPTLRLRWERLTLEEGLTEMGHLFRCPTPGCDNAVILPPPKKRPTTASTWRHPLGPWRGQSMLGRPPQKFSCAQCHRDYCIACTMPWSVHLVSHETASCRAVRDAYLKQQGISRTRERRSERWKAAHARCCPACNAPIERCAGCDHMTCAACHHEFCWRCGGPYYRDAQGLRCMHQPPCVAARGGRRRRRFHLNMFRLPDLF